MLWQRLFKVFAWGLGCGVGIAATIAFFSYRAGLPKKWNTSALKVHAVRAEGLTRLDDQLKEVGVGTVFTVDLENTTHDDLTLPKSARIMQTTKTTGALHGSFLSVDKDYFLPSYHTVSISLSSSDLCAPNTDPKQCFDSYFGNQGQIVIFDETNKYEVRITIPPYTLPNPTS